MLNRYAKGANLSFYKLVHLLQEHTLLIELQVRFPSENKLKSRQRKQYCQTRGQLFTIWDDYIAARKTFFEHGHKEALKKTKPMQSKSLTLKRMYEGKDIPSRSKKCPKLDPFILNPLENYATEEVDDPQPSFGRKYFRT